MLYELVPVYDRQRSFYGKAMVISENNSVKLISYTTPVCAILPNGEFVRLWNGYSATTMRHVNEFRRQNDLPKISKSEWYDIPLAH